MKGLQVVDGGLDYLKESPIILQFPYRCRAVYIYTLKVMHIGMHIYAISGIHNPRCQMLGGAPEISRRSLKS